MKPCHVVEDLLELQLGQRVRGFNGVFAQGDVGAATAAQGGKQNNQQHATVHHRPPTVSRRGDATAFTACRCEQQERRWSDVKELAIPTLSTFPTRNLR